MPHGAIAQQDPNQRPSMTRRLERLRELGGERRQTGGGARRAHGEEERG
jgi:hypothetical protein